MLRKKIKNNPTAAIFITIAVLISIVWLYQYRSSESRYSGGSNTYTANIYSAKPAPDTTPNDEELPAILKNITTIGARAMRATTETAKSYLSGSEALDLARNIATGAYTTDHIFANAVQQTQTLRKLITRNIRDELLARKPEARKTYLSLYERDIELALQAGNQARDALRAVREDNTTKQKDQSALRDSLAKHYMEIFYTYDPLYIEGVFTDLGAANALLGEYTQNVKVTTDAEQKLVSHLQVMANLLRAVQANEDALVAGIKVTLINNQDLGLIEVVK